MTVADSILVIYVGGEDAVEIDRLSRSIRAITVPNGVAVTLALQSQRLLEAVQVLDLPAAVHVVLAARTMEPNASTRIREPVIEADGAESKIVAIHDGRAIWHPHFIKAAIERLAADNAPECDGVLCRTVEVFELRDAEGTVIDELRRSPEFAEPLDLAQILRGDRIWISAMVFRGQFAAPVLSLIRKCPNDLCAQIDAWFERWIWTHHIAWNSERLAFIGRPWEAQRGDSAAVDRENEAIRRFLQHGDGEGLAIACAKARASASKREAHLQRRIIELEDALEQAAVRAGTDEHWIARLHALSNLRTPLEMPPLDTLLDGVTVLSLDIFETCHHRRVAHPGDVLTLVQEELRREGRSEFEDFVEMRREAGRLLRERHADEARRNGEPPLEDHSIVAVYEVVCELLGIDAREAESLARREFRQECAVAYPNQWTLRLYKEARDRGLTVIFLSDMHYPASWLRKLLDYLGYGAGTIWVSCEQGVTKQSGGLFERAEQSLAVTGDAILHVGDNPHADIDPARNRGWRVFHLHDGYFQRSFVGQMLHIGGSKQHDPRFSPTDNVYSAWPWPSRIAAGLARWRSRTDAWEAAESPGSVVDTYATLRRIGFECVGPLALFFTAWVWQTAREWKAERIFFLARDGYFLRDVYQKVCDVWGEAGEVHYLMASRRLLRFSTLRYVGSRDWEFLLKAAPGLRARDFLDRIGINAERYKDRFSDHGFMDLDEVLTNQRGWCDGDRFHKMYHVLCTAMPEIIHRAEEERNRLHAYLRASGVTAGRVIAVDLGWHGSSVDALSEHLRLMRDDWPSLLGCYFATWGAAASVANRGCGFRSFLAHEGSPRSQVKLLQESIALIEAIFSAPHGTVVGLRGNAGAWEPVCDAPEAGAEGFLRQLWEGATQFVDAYLGLVACPFSGGGEPYITAVLERILRHPTAAEVRILGRVPHREGWAAGRIAPIVPEATDSASTATQPEDALLSSYSAWHRGSAVLRSSALSR